MLVQFLGWTAAVLAASVALPQVVRLLRSGSTAGISLTAWRLTLAANAGWTVHGIHTAHPNIVLPNFIFGVFSTTILVLLARDRELRLVPLLSPSLLVAGLTFGLDLWLGPVAFAIAAGLPSVLAQLMQLHELILAPRITGVALPFLVLNVVNQLCWASWSIMVGERSVILCATTIGSLMALNLSWGLLRRYRVVRARLCALSA